jgi:hypothetical protein
MHAKVAAAGMDVGMPAAMNLVHGGA